jgi:hypothetical protein
MKRIEIKKGALFGSLEVISEVPNMGKRHFFCKCECGAESIIRLDHLRSGRSRSCGSCGMEHMGQRKTIEEWANQIGINESTLRARLKVMSLGEAIARGGK